MQAFLTVAFEFVVVGYALILALDFIVGCCDLFAKNTKPVPCMDLKELALAFAPIADIEERGFASRTSGTGRVEDSTKLPNIKCIDLTVAELRQLCKEQGVRTRNKQGKYLRKAELVAVLTT